MKLPASLIYHELRKEYPDLQARLDKEAGAYSSFRILESGEAPCDHALILLSAADCKRAEPVPGTLLLLYDAQPADPFPYPGSVLWFTQGRVLSQVSNSLLRLFDRFDTWEGRLNEILLNNGSMQDILTASLPYVGNMLSVVDRFGHTIATTYDLLPDAERVQVPGALLIMDIEGLLALDGQREVPGAKDDLPRLMTGTDDHPYLNLFIREEHTYLGLLCMTDYPRHYEERDPDLLMLLEPYVRRCLYGQYYAWQGNPMLELETGILHLLQDGVPSEEDLDRMLERIHYDRYDQYLVLVVSLGSSLSPQYDHFFCVQISQAIRGATPVIPPDGQLTILCNLTRSGMTCGGLEAALQALLGDALELAGSSEPFRDFTRLKEAREAALIALRYVRRDPPPGRFTRFSQVALRHALDSCPGGLSPDMLWPAGFHRLLAHDAASTVSYVDTLEAYLNHNMTSLSAAKELHIQRSSFQARMDRIQQLLQQDRLDDPDTRFHYALAIRLYRNKEWEAADG